MKVIQVCAKVSDVGWYGVNDEQGNLIAEHNGYVPDFMPGEHYGDYIELEINSETGQILNWDCDTAKLQTWIAKNKTS